MCCKIIQIKLISIAESRNILHASIDRLAIKIVFE